MPFPELNSKGLHNWTSRYAKGRLKLKKGEYQRSNGTFEYKWTDRYGSRHSLYAKTIEQLRLKEEAVQKDILDGLSGINLNITINSYYEVLNTYTDASEEFKKQEIARLDRHDKTEAV